MLLLIFSVRKTKYFRLQNKVKHKLFSFDRKFVDVSERGVLFHILISKSHAHAYWIKTNPVTHGKKIYFYSMTTDPN